MQKTSDDDVVRRAAFSSACVGRRNFEFKSFKSDDKIKYYDFSAGEDSEVSARRAGSKLDCGDTVET